VLIVWLVNTRTVRAKRAARNALLAPLLTLQDLIHAVCALEVSTTLLLGLTVAVPAPEEPSPLAARALAPSAPRANTLLLDPLLAKAAPLDTTQTSLVPRPALPALLAPNVLVLAAPDLPSALPANSKVSLPRPPAHLAPRKLTLTRLELSNVQPALLPLLPDLPLALLVVGCFLPVSMPEFLNNLKYLSSSFSFSTFLEYVS
jgi:hypothetical protein